jgi:ActR/RegA family two-component response regulator
MSRDEANGEGVLIIDDCDTFGWNLGQSFRALGIGVRITKDLQGARSSCASAPPGLVVTELYLQGEWTFDFIAELRAREAALPVAIATAYPSVGAAVRCTRMGLAGYFAKPVTAMDLVRLVPASCDERERSRPWPSLDGMMGEYINEVFADAGTVAEAARRLCVAPRSLRRMLARCPRSR